MSEEKNNNITEKYTTYLQDKNTNHKIKQTIQITSTEQSIKTQTGKYKYSYSNINNNKIKEENVIINNNNIKENSNLKNNIKINNNIKNNNNNIINNNIYLNNKNFKKNEIISDNQENRCPLDLKNNCETNYSINKITNVKYVNGSNKNDSQLNDKRNTKLLNHNYSEKVINIKKRNKYIKGENSEKCVCDKNAKCKCGKRINNNKIYEKRKIMNLNKVNNNILNHNQKIIKKNYYVNIDNINNLKNNNNINSLNSDILNNTNTENMNTEKMNTAKMKAMNIKTTNANTIDIFTMNSNNTMKNLKRFERNVNVETFPVFFSDEDINSNTTPKLYTNKRIIKYSSPINYRNNRHIKISRYFKENSNTINETRIHRKIKNMNQCHTSNMNFYSPPGKSYNKRNHQFTSICNCSPKSIDSNKNRINYFSSEQRSKNAGSNSKYKYNISIRNINVNRGMKRSTSYENIRTNKKYRYSNEEYYRRNNIRSIQRQDKKKLKMQNAQNMQILQETELFHILVPIPQNKIENSCNIQISGNENNKYSLEEINELKKTKITKKTEIITENEKKVKDKYYNNLVNKEIVQINKEKVKKPNWNKTNKTTKLSYDFSNKKVKMVKKENNELDKEKFEINIPDNGRKFKGDFYIENNIIEYEKKEKDPNANLLLSPNHKISFKAKYPRRNWNNITKPISEKPLSIEGKPKQIILERSVEKIMSIKGKKPKNVKNDWNLSNNEKKEVNINLYTRKKKQKISKERIQPFFIKGKEKNKNFIAKNELNIFIKGIEKNENPEEVIINDDYNQLPRKYNKLHANIKKVYEISDESSSEFDILKDLKMYNEQNNEYKELIINSINNAGKEKQKVIINEIKGFFPNGIEKYEGKRNKNVQFNNILKQNVNNNENTFSKKKVIPYSKKNIIPEKDLHINLKENIPETKVVFREIISKEKTEINNENEQNQQINNNNLNSDIQEDEKDNPISDINSQKSQTKYSYREQIITLSPNRNDNQVDIISNNLSYQSFNGAGFIENQNDFISNTNSNYNLNSTDKKINNHQNNEDDSPFKNNIDNGQNYLFIDNNEQEIPRIQDEEPNILNNYTPQMNEESAKNLQQMQYIFKKENNQSKEEKLNINNSHILKNINFIIIIITTIIIEAIIVNITLFIIILIIIKKVIIILLIIIIIIPKESNQIL